MIRELKHRLSLACLLLGLAPALAPAYQNDYAQDVQITGNPSPANAVTGSSINQYGAGQVDSQVDNLVNQDEQINLDQQSGTVRVLRANQKALINSYVTAVVPLKNVNPRELRGIARTICRKEGGDADVLQDRVNKQFYLVVVCPEFQLPFIQRTLATIDQPWVKEVNDGSWTIYYRGQHRDVRNMMRILQLYRSPDGVWDFDDANNAVLFFDQPNVEPLWVWGTKEVDIPPSQLALDVTIYEVDTQNDLALGLDFVAWKNSLGRNLFELAAWNFEGDNPVGFLSNTPVLPAVASDWGCFRGYDFNITSAYIDFLQSKGRARLVTRSTLTAKSGTVGELAALDPVASFRSTSTATPEALTQRLPFRLADVINYYHEHPPVAADLLQRPSPSVGELAALPAAEATAAINALFAAQGFTGFELIAPALAAKGADGTLSQGDLEDIYVPMTLALQVFRDRKLFYEQSGQAGVLLSILPVVGLKSAEMAVALDVTDVTGFTPAGDPIIEHRYVSSDVEVRDGQPMVLAGLKRTTNVRVGVGIPYLRDIPYAGYLFGREVSTKQQKELVVLMTPRFKLCPTGAVAPPKEYVEAVATVQGQAKLEVPKTRFGFDQWLLDPAK